MKKSKQAKSAILSEKDSRKLYLMYYILFAIIVISLILSGCKTNPPNSPDIINAFGQVFVTSNSPGAQIFLDNLDTGKQTPDTITASAGEHEIKLIKENFVDAVQSVSVLKDQTITISFDLQAVTQKVVLIEDFSNVSCGPCARSNDMIEYITKQSYGLSRVVAIKYAFYAPAPNDPFYLAGQADCDARIDYYNVFFAPTVIIDGILKPSSPEDSLAFIEKIDERIVIEPVFEIEAADSLSGGNYFITIRVKTLESGGINFSDLALQTVLTETDIQFSSPPGSNGETEFFDVMRKMLPGNTGVGISDLNSSGAEKTFTYQVNIDPNWVSANLNAIAFIQNNITKEVLQTGATF